MKNKDIPNPMLHGHIGNLKEVKPHMDKVIKKDLKKMRKSMRGK